MLARPALPGTPELERNRIDILTKAKSEPVIFVQPPEFSSDASRNIRQIRARLASKHAGSVLKLLLQGFRFNPKNGRAALLRDGYLYADSPDRAYLLTYFVSAEHLYDDARIWIQRGERTYHARRARSGKYVYEDGPESGKDVRLILFDRLGVGAPPRPLHRDLRSLRYRLHFDSAEIKHLTEDRIVADLHYGNTKIESVLSSDGARLNLECEMVPPDAVRDIAHHRELGVRKLRVNQVLRRAMIQQIEERLPFDEPYREFGRQMDGVLRQKWVSLYVLGHKKFDLNGDDYYIYDAQGRPLVPQVCADFLTDTFERASGTWWRPRGQKPERVIGGLDLQTLENPDLRRIPGVLAFAQEKHDWFDVYEVPPRERVEFRKQQRFIRYLNDNKHQFQEGDIAVIRGFTPFDRKWETPLMHFHSFFIYEMDPVSGMPIALAMNAGRPTIRVWDTEMRRTPRRSIWYRIRPRLHWLETITENRRATLGDEPVPLSVGPR